MNKLTGKSILKLIIFNLILAIADIFLFSQGYFDINPTSISSARRIFFFVLVVFELIFFVVINYLIIAGPKPSMKLVNQNELKDGKDYIKKLRELSAKKIFAKDIEILIGQIERIEPKRNALITILGENFSTDSMTFLKFRGTIDDVVGLFYDHTKKAMNRIVIFDVNEYEQLRKNQISLSKEVKENKIKVFAQHIGYVKETIQQNEEIITELDSLALELAKLDEINEQALENSRIMAEIEELIKNTKYYA